MWDKTDVVLVAADRGAWYGDHADWNWMWGLHWLYVPAIIVLVLVILFISVRLATRIGSHESSPIGFSSCRRRDSPLKMLDARYAQGEINRGEYFERKRDLT